MATVNVAHKEKRDHQNDSECHKEKRDRTHGDRHQGSDKPGRRHGPTVRGGFRHQKISEREEDENRGRMKCELSKNNSIYREPTQKTLKTPMTRP